MQIWKVVHTDLTEGVNSVVLVARNGDEAIALAGGTLPNNRTAHYCGVSSNLTHGFIISKSEWR